VSKLVIAKPPKPVSAMTPAERRAFARTIARRIRS
jgi:hypothetical protein